MIMYSNTLKPKVDQMFEEIGKKVSETIDASSTRKDAADNISSLVGTETSSRSKTMLSDMYAVLSKSTLDKISNVELQNKFYEADIRSEIFSKYNFSASVSGMGYSEINRTAMSLGIGGGTAVAGAGITAALALSGALTIPIAVPVAIVFAAAVGAFCLSYFKINPDMNKSRFKAAVSEYLETVKRDFLQWFDTIENYFNTRVKEIFV